MQDLGELLRNDVDSDVKADQWNGVPGAVGLCSTSSRIRGTGVEIT